MKIKSHPILSALACLCASASLEGCDRLLLFNPKGPVGDAERFIILAAFGLMLIVAIPGLVALSGRCRRWCRRNPDKHPHAEKHGNGPYHRRSGRRVWIRNGMAYLVVGAPQRYGNALCGDLSRIRWRHGLQAPRLLAMPPG